MSRSPRRRALGAALLSTVLVLLTGCSSGPGAGPRTAPSASVTSPDYSLDTASPAPGSTRTPNPYEFGARIDNPWLPLWPGTRMRYVGRGRRAGTSETVTVTRDTRMVTGVVTTVVRTTTRAGHRPGSWAQAYYAQDIDGNVWLFGRDRRSPAGAPLPGSWLAGAHGATPVVVMPALPRPGATYDGGDPAAVGAGPAARRRETVLRIGRRPLPAAHRAPVLESVGPRPRRPTTHSYYAKGVGLVRFRTPRAGWELVRTTLFD